MTDALIRDANPVPDRPAGLDDRARADLAAILASPVPAARRTISRRRAGLLVAGAAGLAAASAVGVPVLRNEQIAYAASPPPMDYRPLPGVTAPALLSGIARRTAGLPDDTGTGRYTYIETRSWDLFSGEGVRSHVEPLSVQTWTAADGSGRSVTVRVPTGRRPQRDEQVYAAGQHNPMWPLRSLSSDDRVLAGQLARNHPTANGPAERLVAIGDAYRDQPLPPAVRAALLRYLARTPGLTVTGTVTDRAGRQGVAVSVDSAASGLPTRYTLVIDRGTGRLLATEDTLTTTAGKLRVRIPSVIGYEIFLAARYTDQAR